MNRFLAFVMNSFYPKGGMNDCIGYYKTYKEACDAIQAEIDVGYNDYEFSVEVFDTKNNARRCLEFWVYDKDDLKELRKLLLIHKEMEID